MFSTEGHTVNSGIKIIIPKGNKGNLTKRLKLDDLSNNTYDLGAVSIPGFKYIRFSVFRVQEPKPWFSVEGGLGYV